MDSVFPLDFSLPHEDSQQLILLKFLILKTPHTYVVKKKKKFPFSFPHHEGKYNLPIFRLKNILARFVSNESTYLMLI